MIRVLHLLPSVADFQTARSVQQLLRDPGGGFCGRQMRVGRGGECAGAAAAVLRLRRERFDILHAWGTGALTAAVFGGAERILYAPDAALRLRSVRWVRAVTAHRDVHVICPTATLRRMHVERGVPLERCHLIRPAVDFARVRRRRDAELRNALGFGDRDRVILSVGESTRAAGHEDAVWAMSILHVMDERYRLLLWGRGDQADPLERFAQKLAQPRLLTRAEDRLHRRLDFEQLLPAADMALITARGHVPTLPIAICMAAALPIVSTVTYTVSELLEDRHTALMVGRQSPREIARRVLDMEEDQSLQWRLADMARTEAYEYFSLTRFLNQHRAAYRQLAAGEALDVPQPPPGAGLRFHGRV